MPRWKKLGLVGAVLLLVFVTLNALFIWFPRSDRPARADVVVVIGGTNTPGRLARGVALVRAGYAPELVTDAPAPPQFLCSFPVKSRCFEPDPDTTQGEARAVAAMARASGWTSILLVVSTDQATRARVRFRRCYHLGLRVVTVATIDIAYETAYQDAAMLKAETLQRGC